MRLLLLLMLLVLVGCQRADPVPVPAPPPVKSFAPPSSQKQEPATDAERLQGSWRAVRIEKNGRISDFSATWQFQGNLATLHEGMTSTGTFSIDEKASPKTLDLKMSDGDYACIYELQDDMLRVCFVEAGPRPTDFTIAGTPRILLVFKRNSSPGARAG